MNTGEQEVRIMEHVTSRKAKGNTFTVVARIKNKKEKKTFKKEFQKMIRKCNHLLEGGISFELLIITNDKCSHLGE